MKYKISASNLFSHHYLLVHDKGIKFYEPGVFRSVRKFAFSEILCLLTSPDNTLSFQVGNEVFSIPTKPKNAKHQATIAALVQHLENVNNLGRNTSASDVLSTPNTGVEDSEQKS